MELPFGDDLCARHNTNTAQCTTACSALTAYQNCQQLLFGLREYKYCKHRLTEQGLLVYRRYCAQEDMEEDFRIMPSLRRFLKYNMPDNPAFHDDTTTTATR